MDKAMLIILTVFIILVLYDLPRFIKRKEQAKVFVIYSCLMVASLIVSLLLAADKRPPSPAQWLESIFKIIGVIK
jgi:hypothetical protein